MEYSCISTVSTGVPGTVGAKLVTIEGVAGSVLVSCEDIEDIVVVTMVPWLFVIASLCMQCTVVFRRGATAGMSKLRLAFWPNG